MRVIRSTCIFSAIAYIVTVVGCQSDQCRHYSVRVGGQWPTHESKNPGIRDTIDQYVLSGRLLKESLDFNEETRRLKPFFEGMHLEKAGGGMYEIVGGVDIPDSLHDEYASLQSQMAKAILAIVQNGSE